jgi:hypothetical protein
MKIKQQSKIQIGNLYQDKLGNIVKVVAMNTHKKVTFQWEDGYTRVQPSCAIILNTIMKEEDSCYFNPKFKVGDRIKTSQGATLEVVKYEGSRKIQVCFVDFDMSLRWTNWSNLSKGHIHHPKLPSVMGIGILGELPIDGRPPEYCLWTGMLKRVVLPRQPNYEGCSVSDEWKYFINFKDWFMKQTYYSGYALDKDVLFKGNKLYSKDTCCLVPREINNFLTNRRNHRGPYPVGVTYHARINKYQATCNRGSQSNYFGVYNTQEEAFAAYKTAKENYAKELAGVWKSKVDNKVYEALMKFEVSIED